jgi:hypothetical protein|tara:strand:+ start:280 stop:483 length:204 start_codon:yes stop_codon:yes gene_type:complete
METNYWQIDENLYKVHISSDVYEKIVKEFSVEDTAKYIKDGEVFAYDIMIKEDKLKKVIKRLEEFDC